MTTPTPQTVIEKIKKLLALGQSANENEAAVAASMAQKLMLEHKLSIGEVELAGIEKKSPVSEAFIVEKMGTFGYMTWKGALVHGIALLNGCRTIRYSGNRLMLIGRESDRELVEYLACFLSREIERLAFEDFARQGFQGNKQRWTWVQSFGMGATRTVTLRMREEQTKMATADVRVTALVRREDKAIAEYMRSAHPHTKTTTSRPSIRSEALANGAAAGRSIQWTKGVSGSNGTRGAIA
jgi:hypothetical protein